MKLPKTINLPSLKLPTLNINTCYVMSSLTNGLISELTSAKRVTIGETQMQGKQPIGAGRGGKYYSENRSHYSHF